MKDQDRPSNIGVDQSVDGNQDRSGWPDSDQLETDGQEDCRLSYAPSEEPVMISPERQSTVVPPSERETPAFQPSGDPPMRTPDPHAPDKAPSESQSSGDAQQPRPSSHIRDQYDDENNKDFVNISDEYLNLEEVPKRSKSSKEHHRRRSRKRREKRKGKPTCWTQENDDVDQYGRTKRDGLQARTSQRRWNGKQYLSRY